jgi:hypothetical protein
MSTSAQRALAHVRGLSTVAPMPAASITVNFHPYRLLADDRTVAEHLAAEGVYRSQFETGISNGGVGGFRAVWEQRMFAGAYTEPAGRGPGVPPLARALGAPVIDAAVIGRAAQSAVRDPAAWARFGEPAEVLQLLKYAWHILVLLGEPAC